MKTRELIHGVFVQNGWHRVETATWFDAFERYVEVDPESALGKYVTQADWDAAERVVVQYKGYGGRTLSHGAYYGPGQRVLLTGKFGQPLIYTEGRDQKEQIIKWAKA